MMTPRPDCGRSIVVAALAVMIFITTSRSQTGLSPISRQESSIRLLASALGEGLQEGVPIKCGLPVYSAAVHQRSQLTGALKVALNELDVRPQMQTSVVSGGFRIHFDTTGANTPALLNALHQRIAGTARAFVDSAIAVMADVYAVEIGELGFAAPPADGVQGGGNEYDIYIMELGNLYGQTLVDDFTQDGSISTTFIEVDNDFIFVSPSENKGIPGLEVTLAHEFHHAIQIGSYGFWTADVWYHEVTSTWMEDVVYTNVNDYYNYLYASFSQFHHPQTQLNSFPNDYVEYSRGIWGQFITKRYGPDAMKKTWEAIRSLRPLDAIDATLKGFGSRLGLAFAEWTLWNYYTGERADTVSYYPEGRNFPLMDAAVFALPPVSRQVNDMLPCLSSAYYRFITGSDSLAVLIAHLSTPCPMGAAASPFSFVLTRQPPDGNYRSIGLGYYLKLSVDNPSEWIAWNIGPSGAGGINMKQGMSFPNPFLAGNQSTLYFPVEVGEGTLTIYSPAMELVYSGHQSATSHLGQRVLTWDGKTSTGQSARSGVYLFILDVDGKSISGKFALVRQ